MVAYSKRGRFQYPLRVEVGCNPLIIHAVWHVEYVSVPSTGRSGLQHPDTPNAPIKRDRFSTLYGSKWVATLIKRGKPHRVKGFQYPLRVEVGCNMVGGTGVGGTGVFQYPLRVEVGCNQGTTYSPDRCKPVSVPSTGRSGLQPHRIRIAPSAASSFSTLYGSKWVATKLQSPVTRIVVEFQYPLRVEVGCNATRAKL